MRTHLFSVVVTLIMFGCGGDIQQPTTDTAQASRAQSARDYGDIGNYHACQAKPRRELTNLEKCEIEVLSEGCTPAADCLITCISSPDGYKRGGGCYHICFNPPASHTWESRPKVDFGMCEQFEIQDDDQSGRS